MTATDLATMRRIGAPTVSPDGRWLVYHVERDRSRRQPPPQRSVDRSICAIAANGPSRLASSSAEHNEHDARFAPDGLALFHQQRNRAATSSGGSTMPGGPMQRVTRFPDRCRRLPDRADRRPDRDLGRSRHALRRHQLRERARPPKRGQGSGRTYDETFVRHWDTWATPGVRSRIFVLPMADGRPQGAGTPVSPEPRRRFAVQAVRRRRGAGLERATGGRSISPCAKAGGPSPIRPISTSMPRRKAGRFRT